MKAVWLGLVLLIFNISMATVAYSGLFTAAPYYESSTIDRYSGLANFTNMTKTDLDTQTIDIWDYILGGVGFGWANQYVLVIDNSVPGYYAAAQPFLVGLNIIAGFLYAIAAIEFFWRQSIEGG